MDKTIHREIADSLKSDMFKGKVLILTGARQVGKTTLMKSILSNFDNVLNLNADNPTDRSKLENQDFEKLNGLVGSNKIVFIDEAQKVPNIGDTLKLLVDNYKDTKQIIATGSSSLNLLSNTQEPLTGRKYVHELFSLSMREIFPGLNPIDLEKELPSVLVYGTYPEIYTSNENDKQRLLTEIVGSYLYQDILELEQVRNPATLQKLLSAIALQLGSEVSLNELSNLVGLDLKTVERYIDLLEKNFVLFRLSPYYTNQRKTLSKLNKIYFYDLGIRNALINNFNPLDLRNDVGALWENFLIVERMKLRQFKNIYSSQYFWRTYDGAEIDLVEEREGKLFGYEIKWKKNRTQPKSWLDYPNSEYKLVNQENFIEFLQITPLSFGKTGVNQ
ncbi:MAG: ATP-binding protein [Patescibacteria group bacterium]